MSHPPPPPGAERRQHPRAPVEAAVTLTHGDLIVLTSIVDASLGGAFIAVPREFDLAPALGTTVTIDLGKATPILQEARVVRVVEGPPRGIAVAWRAATPATVTALRALLPVPRLPSVGKVPRLPSVGNAAPAKRTAYTARDVGPRSNPPAADGKVHHARGRKEAP